MALNQSQYRFGENSGTESTHGWLAALSKPVMLPPGRPFLLRIGVQAVGTGGNNVLIDGNGAETINGVASITVADGELWLLWKGVSAWRAKKLA